MTEVLEQTRRDMHGVVVWETCWSDDTWTYEIRGVTLGKVHEDNDITHDTRLDDDELSERVLEYIEGAVR
jgi:hypothetical protein